MRRLWKTLMLVLLMPVKLPKQCSIEAHKTNKIEGIYSPNLLYLTKYKNTYLQYTQTWFIMIFSNYLDSL